MSTAATQPVVSIIIPAFNRAELILETLDSISRQTFADWEAVVVDDGSTDTTSEIVTRCAATDSRVRFLSRERPPKGASTCRNLGLAAARGDLVVFLDSDDLLGRDCLERRVAVMTGNPRADYAVFQGLLFKQTPGDLEFVLNLPNNEPDLCRFLRGDPVWQTTGPIWKKSAVQQLGGFDEQFACWQDTDLHFRALNSGLAYLKRFDLPPDYFHRKHNLPSISQKGFNYREAVVSTLQFCIKAADALKSPADADKKNNLRSMLASQVQLALANRHFDLADQGIELAIQNRLLDFRAKALWRLARHCHRARALGIRGLARLGNRLLRPYRPALSLGIHRLAEKPDAAGRAS
jgi:glycosyltransferase involved in cell wall biosynthesis